MKRGKRECEMNLEDAARQAQEAIRARRGGTAAQSVALAVFLTGIAGAALTIALSAGDSLRAYLVMFFAMCACVWLAAYRFRYLAVILGALQMLTYTVYQLYGAIGAGRHFTPADYAWLFLPETCIAAMIAFMSGVHRVEQMADVLEDKIASLEVVEPVTGLPNLRSLYMDLERQMAYAVRNGVELTLIIFELRYEQELRSILTGAQFAQLKRRMGALAEEAMRLEDRVYAIDERGSLGIVCMGCGREGAVTVRNRVRGALSGKESFEGILDRKLRVDVRAGYATYDREEIENAMALKQRAESELQYDV